MDLIFILRVVGASQLALILGILIHSKRPKARGIVFVSLLALGVISFLLFPIVERWHIDSINLVFRFFRASTAFWFWILALHFFNEPFQLKTWHWVVLLLKLFVHFLFKIPQLKMFNENLFLEDGLLLSSLLTAMFSALLVGHGVFKAMKDYSDDLVEWRRSLRVLFTIVGGLSILAVILSRLIFRGPYLQGIFEHASVMISVIAIFLFGMSILRIRPDFSFDDPDKGEADDNMDLELKKSVLDRMELEKEYRDEGLTIRILAVRLGVLEYKLRRLININMQFKNFNDFLNRYRIQEVSKRLLSEPEVPITRLAMDAGFRSLGTFNRAFRQLLGMSPSEYKKLKSNPDSDHQETEKSEIE